MALIAVAADKGAPGVTTTALALAAVWPRPVLLAECDPAGGDLVYRFPAAGGDRLDPRRGLLSLAVAARRGLQPHQAWEHTQKLNGGLDILTGVTSAEQGAGLNLLWGPVGRVLAGNSQADVIADCGRLGIDGPHYDLLAEAALVVLVTRASLGEVVRLRERVTAVAAALRKRGRAGAAAEVVVIADHKNLRNAIAEIGQALEPASAPARIAGGLAEDPRGADLLRGEWGGKLDKSLLIRTARDIAEHLAARLPAGPVPAADRAPDRGGYPGQPAQPSTGAVPATDGEPVVSAATWAASPARGTPRRVATPRWPGPPGRGQRAGGVRGHLGGVPRRAARRSPWLPAAGRARPATPGQPSAASSSRPHRAPVTRPPASRGGDRPWTIASSRGSAETSGTGWPSSAAWTPRPGSRRCRGRTSASSPAP